jgi:hypothetical protein
MVPQKSTKPLLTDSGGSLRRAGPGKCGSGGSFEVSLQPEVETFIDRLLNQSQSSQQTNLTLNTQRIRMTGDGSVWRLDNADSPAPVREVGELQVAPGSIAAIKFQGIQPAIRFTRTLQDSETWKTDYTEIRVGNGRAMRLAFGREQAWVYAYFQDEEQAIQSVTLRHRDGSSGWKTEVDNKYPFEFSVDLAPDATRWEAEFIVQQPGGQQQREAVTLSK